MYCILQALTGIVFPQPHDHRLEVLYDWAKRHCYDVHGDQITVYENFIDICTALDRDDITDEEIVDVVERASANTRPLLIARRLPS